MTPEQTAMRDRLLAMYSHRGDGLPTQYVNPDGTDAWAMIERQAAEIERLRGFAESVRNAYPGWASDRIGALRKRAQSALESGKEITPKAAENHRFLHINAAEEISGLENTNAD